jgi:heme A synthase
MFNLTFELGALLPTFILSRIVFWILFKRDGGLRKLVFVHVVCLLLAALLAGMGMANGGAFVPLIALELYALPQGVWFGIDYFRFTRKLPPLTIRKRQSIPTYR